MITTEELVIRLLNGQIQVQQSVSELAKTISGYIEIEDRRSERLTAANEALAASVSRFVESSDARLKRLEANLDALIRTISSEHENGKQKS